MPENPGGTVFEMLTVQEVPARRPDFPVAGDRVYVKVGRMRKVEGRGKRCSWRSEDAIWSRSGLTEHKYTAALIQAELGWEDTSYDCTGGHAHRVITDAILQTFITAFSRDRYDVRLMFFRYRLRSTCLTCLISLDFSYSVSSLRH